jgi:hypothetical protein
VVWEKEAAVVNPIGYGKTGLSISACPERVKTKITGRENAGLNPSRHECLNDPLALLA